MPQPGLPYRNPLIDTDFPDPGILFDEKSQTWYAYSTNANGKNVQGASSRDFVNWTLHPYDVLPNPLPQWTHGKPNMIWAPEVIHAPSPSKDEKTGHETSDDYRLFVTVHDHQTGRQSIAVGKSNNPLGPFVLNNNGPLVSQGELGGTIDPQPFRDPRSGKLYLLYKNDGNHENSATTKIWIQELNHDATQFVGDAHTILTPLKDCPWMGNLIEAPYNFYHEEANQYILFFSANGYAGDRYAVGFAISENLTGPYQCSNQPLLYTIPGEGVYGPGGQSIVHDKAYNQIYIVYHAWDQPHGRDGRRMCVNPLNLTTPSGSPQLVGTPSYRLLRKTGYEHIPPSFYRRMEAKVLRLIHRHF